MLDRLTTPWLTRLTVALPAALLAGCCACPQPHPPAPGGGTTAASGPLSAGAASVVIALPNEPSLAGYGGPPRRVIDAQSIALAIGALGPGCIDPTPSTAAVFFEPATGTKDALTARALVLANGTRKVAIVKVDAIGMSRKLRDELAAAAVPLGIAAPHLAVVATHTHSGPGGVADRPAWQIAATDCFAAAVYQAVKSAAVDALTQANAGLQPARLGIGTTTVLGANRNRRKQPTVVDQELGLVKVTTTGGTPLAALFNFAVHGTSYRADHMQFSADCMGAMEEAVEAKLPGAVAIFTNGAEGDVAPEFTDDAGVQQEGQIVGDAVLALWPTVPTKSVIDLRGALQDAEMPTPRYNPQGCLPLADSGATLCDITGDPLTVPLAPSWLSTTLPFQALRIDDTAFVTVPGEPVTEIGWELKAYAKTQGLARGFVLGLANDHGGYFATLKQYQAGTYEGTATLYGPDSGRCVVTNGKRVIDLVK